MNPDKELIKGHLESVILRILLYGDDYGYEMIKKIKSHSQGLFEIKEGTLYVVLKRLEQQNYICSYWNENNKVGSTRKYYKITNNGIRYFNLKKDEWLFLKRILNKFYEGC